MTSIIWQASDLITRGINCQRVRSLLCVKVLAAAMLGFSLPGAAQLPVGGFLGPEPISEIVEEAIEAALERQIASATEQNIQENIEDTIEETVERSVDETVEESIDEVVAQTVEEGVEEAVEESVASAVEANVESGVEDSIEQTVEDAVGDAVEDGIETGVEESVAQAVEDQVESAVEDSVSESVSQSIETSVEEAVADTVATTVEESVEDSVADSVEQTVAQTVEASVEADVEAAVETSVEATVETSVEQRVELAIEERLETEIDEILDNLESDLEVDESRILKEQWLVMAEPAVFLELTDKGYLFDTVTELPALGLRLAEVAAPSTFDILDVRDGVLDVVGKDRAEVDLNHIYTAGAPQVASSEGVLPRNAMAFPADTDDLDIRVGMIDSRVDTTHPALSNSNIETRSFARAGAAAPDFHGTAIASIIAANSDEYQGLAPNAQVYAASVFEMDAKRGEIASTVSLIRALDWLISTDVDVVNISLAGPPNRLLERALDKAALQDVVVMAAAGNGGPVARPMYPAAYSSVVAVTAVDSAQQVFRLANRGEYLALAAPGVDLRHAQPGGGYAASSGTSFAVPFAVTAAARLSRIQPDVNIIDMLLSSAMDLGPPGRDSIYGYGLLTLGAL